MLYKFENDQKKKKIGCVGSCGYAPASVNKGLHYDRTWWWNNESFPIKNIKCHGTAFRTPEVLLFLSIDPKYDGS